MSSWSDPIPVNLPVGYQETLGISKLAAEIMVKRGFSDLNSAQSFLYPKKYHPTPASEMPGVQQALDVILHVIGDQLPILVWGDFDVDGQTATTILVSALRELGARVNHYIPVRETESHGIHISKHKNLIENFGLLLTCDTGITAHEEIKFAKDRGLAVVVTDHHDLPESLPPADAIVTSKLLNAGHPLASLPGVGVAYKLVEGLFESRGRTEKADEFLDLVALGIVADMAELVGDTRYLLQQGLERLRTTPRVGLQALFTLAELAPANLTEEHIGYGIAPRLNALGRLGDANLIVDFLTTQDKTKARLTAIELEALNAKRKLLTDQVFEGAMAQIERHPLWADDAAIVFAHHLWPGGVIGIVASRLTEYFHKPVILITVAPDGKGRGSARSIPGVNVTQAIASQIDLLDGFGGHPMAGGLSIHSENIEDFRSGFIQAVKEQTKTLPATSQPIVDAWVDLKQLTLDFALELSTLAPFGPGNPPVSLAARDLQMVSHRKIGRYGEHLRVTVADRNNVRQDIIWWQGSGYSLPELPFDLSFTIRPSTFRGQPVIEVVWLEARETNVPHSPTTAQTSLQIVDCRQIQDPDRELLNYAMQPDTIIWCEAQICPVEGCIDRSSISPAKRLVIWTIPPSRADLLQTIRKARPEIVVCFASKPNMDEPTLFLRRLAGIIKYAMNHQEGLVIISDLAAATSQPEITVQIAIEWLCARGDLFLERSSDLHLFIRPGDRSPKTEAKILENQLKLLLSETAAFRKYYQHGDLDQIME
jgi:single-stranded-DNA-specific exonuclease